MTRPPPDQDPNRKPPAQGGFGHQPQGGYAAPPPQGGYGPGMVNSPQQSQTSTTAKIVTAVIAVLAIGGVILAFVLVNRTPAPSAVVQGDDAALNALAQECFDGTMSACDDLWSMSPVDSDYESYGDTCGGRIAAEDVDRRFCVDIF